MSGRKRKLSSNNKKKRPPPWRSIGPRLDHDFHPDFIQLDESRRNDLVDTDIEKFYSIESNIFNGYTRYLVAHVKSRYVSLM